MEALKTARQQFADGSITLGEFLAILDRIMAAEEEEVVEEVVEEGS